MSEKITCFRCQGEGNIGTYWEDGRCHNVKCPDCNGDGNVDVYSHSGQESSAAWRRVGARST